jgi:hypothetical protein
MYTNSDGLPSTPFCSGPLEGYTIIQLLSPLVFFFRIVDSLRYTATNRPVTEEELNRCDQNGDVAVEHTTVRWKLVATSVPGTRSKNEEDAGDIAQAVDPANTEHQGVHSQGNAKGSTSKEDPNFTEELEDQFSDVFADEVKPIEHHCHYLRAKLLSHQQNRYHELIPRVFASTNDRLPAGTGFGYQYQGRNFRPGRTLLVPLRTDENHVLLATQVQPDNRINLRVLDPMTWRTTVAVRISIFERTKELMSSSKW